MALIIIDPGHGGKQAGAAYDERSERFDGLREKDFNLGVGLFAELMLTISGVRSRMTRERDRFVSLKDRVKETKVYLPDAYVSIHADAFSGDAEGFTVYHNADGLSLAIHIGQNIAAEFPDQRNRGVKSATYYVLRKTAVPAVLVECGFVSSLEERVRLRRPENQYKYALAITQGVNLWLNEAR